MDESMDLSTAEPSTPSQVDDSVGSETPSQTPQPADTSQESTNSTQGKRWNLRTRKPKQTTPTQEEEKEEEEDDEETMETSKPSTSTRAAAPRKREGSAVKPPAAKRKSTPASRAKATPAVQKKKNDMASVMFNSVMGGKSALKSLASDWVDNYQSDPENAMVDLIQFFVLCCGCKARITLDMFREDTSDVIRTLTENFAEESGEYPLIMTGPTNKKFKSNFSELIRHVILQCKHSIIYDEYMLDTLIVWLVGFTDSQVRAFRHTCTMACMKLVSSLIGVASFVNSELDNTQRQVEAERKRQLERRTEVGQTKLEKLVTKRGELQRNKSELEDTMKGLFSSVFVHRYKDVRPEIRVVCISELGVWMVKYGVKFLADSYLKYVGWMLYDKVGDVRLACLQVLESLYESSDTAPHLELFTERFKSRLLSMRLDVDEHAAVTAITVLGHMQSLDLLDSEDSLEVCELLFLENRAISHAAGQFSVGYLFSDDFMTRAKQKKVLSGRKKPTDGEIMLTELIKFFCEVKIHDHASYFVDSLWDYTEVLKDWQSMTQLLLDEKCGIVLNSEEEAVLIEIMACAVRRAVGATPPAGRAKGKVLSNKEKRAVEEGKTELSEHLMVSLPQLIAKFGSDFSNAANLANIPQQFDLEIYAENRLQKNLEDLLSHLHQLTLKHVETAVLDECAKSYRHLVDPEFSLHSTADIAFHKLVDELVQNFKQYYTEYKEDSTANDQDEEVSFSLEVSMSRLTAYFKVMKLSSDQFSVELNELLSSGVNGDCHEKILANVIVCLKLEIMWSLYTLEQAATPDRTAMRAVHSKLVSLFKACRELVKFGCGRDQREAYVTFTDLLVMFAKQLRKNAQLANLVYVPDFSLQTTLQEYVIEHVINTDEDDDNEPTTDEEALVMAERLNDRRVLLAAFLKLCMFSVVDMKLAAPLWEQYIRQYHNFGDLIKLSMNRCREANPSLWSKTVIASLKGAFLAHLEENGGSVDQTSVEWTDMKELAKKFALSLGFDAMKDNVRQPLVRIHREGVMFALSKPSDQEEEDELEPPPNLHFLIILSEFSHRLLLQDRTGTNGIVPFLLRHSPSDLVKRIPNEKIKGWEAWSFYYQATQPQTMKGRFRGSAANRKRILKDSFLSARPSKVARVEATPTRQSEQGSEMSDVGSVTPPPDPPTVTKTTKGRTTRRSQVTASEL